MIAMMDDMMHYFRDFNSFLPHNTICERSPPKAAKDFETLGVALIPTNKQLASSDCSCGIDCSYVMIFGILSLGSHRIDGIGRIGVLEMAGICFKPDSVERLGSLGLPYKQQQQHILFSMFLPWACIYAFACIDIDAMHPNKKCSRSFNDSILL